MIAKSARNDRPHRGRSAPRSAIALIVTATLGFAACGGSEADEARGDDPTGGGGNIEGEITHAWWGSGERNERTTAVIDLFQQEYPDVAVTTQNADYDAYQARLIVQATAGDLPCVPQMQNTFLAQFASRGATMPLDGLVESGAIDVSGIDDAVLATGRDAEGNLMMIPTGIFLRAWNVNATMFENAGVELPSDDWTWEDYARIARELQPELPEGVYASGLEGGTLWSFVTYVQGHGQDFFTEDGLGFDKQLMIDWFEYWEGLRADGVTVTAEMWAEEQEPLELQYLANNQVAMAARAANQVTAQQSVLESLAPGSEIVRVQDPEGPAGSGDFIGTSGQTIGANCENVDAAAAFVDFFANDPEAAAAYGANNGAPSVDDLRQALIENPDTSEDVVQQLEFTNEVLAGDPPTLVIPGGWTTLMTATERAYESVVFGEQTIEEAVDAYFANAEQVIGGA